MGRAIAESLTAKGTRTVVASRTESQLAESVAAAGELADSFVCDVSDPDQIDDLVRYTVSTHGRLDILVCAHGIYQGGGTVLDLSLDQFDHTMAVNLRSCFHVAKRAAEAMRDGGDGGRMVFISSMNGIASQTNAVDYDVSKVALLGLTRALALEFAPFAITVNAIAPGWVRTTMSEEELEHLDAEGLVMNPLQRVGAVEDIAGAAAWLTDPGTNFVTGTTVTVDGGQTAMLPLPWDPSAPSAFDTQGS
jgi:NAD(P)-dependent dehydrogenase (short-subunit alcohol dehydrogenase family)